MLENCNTIPYNQSKRRINQVLSLLEEHSTVFSVQLTQKRSKSLFCICFLNFCLDPDPKQIMSNPDPGKVTD